MDPLELAQAIATELDAGVRNRPVTVAIDGPDGSGASALADRVAQVCRSRGRPVVRITGEDFLRPRHIRYRRGTDSPVGFLEDTFDDDAFRQLVLEPLNGGDGRIVQKIRDPRTDTPVDSPAVSVDRDALVLVDGTFLLRRSLRDYWGLRVLLAVDDERVARAAHREQMVEEGADGVVADHRQRRARGFALYLERDDPESVADIVIDTTDDLRPVPLRWLRPPGVGVRTGPDHDRRSRKTSGQGLRQPLP